MYFICEVVYPRHQIIVELLCSNFSFPPTIRRAIDAFDNGVGEQPMAQITIFQGQLVPAGRGIGNNIFMEAAITKTLIVSISGMTSINEKKPPAFGCLQGVLYRVPRYCL